MAEITNTTNPPEPLLGFHVYSRRWPPAPADKNYCVAAVHEGGRGVGFYQCQRKPKHEYGGHGWCTQHYPPNEKARRDARHAEWKRASEERQATWKRATAERKLRDAAMAAIRQIAAGHNDPRALAQEVLALADGDA